MSPSNCPQSWVSPSWSLVTFQLKITQSNINITVFSSRIQSNIVQFFTIFPDSGTLHSPPSVDLRQLLSWSWYSILVVASLLSVSASMLFLARSSIVLVLSLLFTLVSLRKTPLIQTQYSEYYLLSMGPFVKMWAGSELIHIQISPTHTHMVLRSVKLIYLNLS